MQTGNVNKHIWGRSVKWGLYVYVIVHTIFPPSPVILWIELGGKPKWLPLKCGYHDVMHAAPISIMHSLRERQVGGVFRDVEHVRDSTKLHRSLNAHCQQTTDEDKHLNDIRPYDRSDTSLHSKPKVSTQSTGCIMTLANDNQVCPINTPERFVFFLSHKPEC